MRKLVAIFLLLTASLYALDKQPLSDYRARRERLAKQTNGGFVLLFAATEAEGQNNLYGFKQDPNFFYLTGWSEPGAALLIAPAADAKDGRTARPYTEILFLPGRNVSQENWTGPKLQADSPNATTVTGFARVEVLDRLRDELVRLLPSPRATVYSDLPSFGETSPSAVPIQWLQRANAFPNYISLADVKPLLSEMRMRKDAGEMERIRKATNATMEALRAAYRAIRPGVTERQIAALIEYEYGRRGCERPGFSSIVASGANSTVLHYSENAGTMQAGDVVVMDVGGEYGMYTSDISRTAPVSGKFTPRQREIYNIVLGAQQAAIDAFQAGKFPAGATLPNSLYRVAYDYINTHGKDRNGEPLGKYFVHGLSHYVGLAVHDTGNTSVPLDRGMVFSIEPGIYIPEEKIGVRIEDLFWVDPDGKLVHLTQGLPRTAEEVEAAMAEAAAASR